jgi:hypothetical protein
MLPREYTLVAVALGATISQDLRLHRTRGTNIAQTKQSLGKAAHHFQRLLVIFAQHPAHDRQ